MSMTLMARAMAIKTGNPIRKLVLIKLADNANDSGECWPSYKHIADHCECSKSAVRDHIDALIAMGLLVKENRPGVKNGKGNASNLYYMKLDNPMPPKSTGVPPESTPPMPCGGTRTSHSFEPVNEPKDPPNPQMGEAEEIILADAKKALEFYNDCTGNWSPQKLVIEGIDRSGILGPLMEYNNMAEKASGGMVGLGALLGTGTQSRYASRGFIGSALGPTFGLLDTITDVTVGVLNGDAGDRVMHNVRTLLPGNNLFWIAPLINQIDPGMR